AATTTFDTGATSVALTVLGNAYFNFGNNNNSFMPTGDIHVSGSLQLTEGNGNDATNIGNSTVSTIGGNLIITLGNGADSTTVNSKVGGTTFYRSGNGSDSLLL